MSIFITGSTGHLGARLVYDLLNKYEDKLLLLIRANSHDKAKEKLWGSLQLYIEFKDFDSLLQNDRIKIVLGDITVPKLGFGYDTYNYVLETTDSIIHCAAILNRKSVSKCNSVNVNGTKEIIALAKDINRIKKLRKFSYISTVAVAGARNNEFLSEDKMIEWERKDCDPYCTTKKIAEKLVMSLDPEIEINIFRPSAIIGDSDQLSTAQFTMLKPLTLMGRLPILPLSAKWRLDIVPVDFVSQAIAKIHNTKNCNFIEYNLSSGRNSTSYSELTKLVKPPNMPAPLFMPFLFKPVEFIFYLLSKTPSFLGISKFALLIKVFMPFIGNNTTYDNSRVINEFGIYPKPFIRYGKGVIKYSKENNFKYIPKPIPKIP